MDLQSLKPHTSDWSRPTVLCAQCGDALFAPEWSEYLDERHIRHLWCCDACGYRFERTVRYPTPVAEAI